MPLPPAPSQITHFNLGRNYMHSKTGSRGSCSRARARGALAGLSVRMNMCIATPAGDMYDAMK